MRFLQLPVTIEGIRRQANTSLRVGASYPLGIFSVVNGRCCLNCRQFYCVRSLVWTLIPQQF